MIRLRLRWTPNPKPTARYLVAILGPLAVTLTSVADPHPPATVTAALYVLAVVVAAGIGGASAGIGASILSFVCLNFFFTRPLHTLAVGTGADVAALLVFLVVALIVGLLLSTALSERARAERREREARLLNELATRLLTGEHTEKVLAGFARGLCEVFKLRGCEITTTFTNSTIVRIEDVGDSRPYAVVLEAKGRRLGAMRVWVGFPRERLGDEEQQAIDNLGTQLALALEATRLHLEIRRAELEAQASRLKADLFSGVTHDVKTPLAAIMASTTSLLDGPDFSIEQRREHLDTIREEGERLNRVVNNLLDLARLRAGALIVQKTPGAIDELMESVISRLRPLLGDRDVEIRLKDHLPEVAMDVVQIDQVLTNLIENAIKFSPPRTPISLSSVGHADGVRVTVADRGSGVRVEDRERIFEPFERGATNTSGTGLGLAIARAIVTAHGGSMWVTDNPAGGAVFTFELPRDPTFKGARLATNA